MQKIKKPLMIATATLILAAAAVLGVLSAVKTTPWELTYHLVPSDVTAAMVWQGSNTSQLTQDEIVRVVHLVNKLEKASFTIKYAHTGIKPQYGLTIQCGDLQIHLNQIDSPFGTLVMTFDKTTAKSFTTGQWYINSSDLTAYIRKLLNSTPNVAPPST